MRFSDYKCSDCDYIFEYCKEKDLDDWPETVECTKCGLKAKRIFNIGTIDIAEGKLGNAKNGYSTGSVSHCSEYGKYKGIKIEKNIKE